MKRNRSTPIPLVNLPCVAASDLLGTWRIVETNFPMWLNGSKADPTLNYGASDTASRLEDVVRYTAGGRSKEIRGVDTQAPDSSAHFVWRGRGVLALFTSDWYVVHHDLDVGVLAIYFTRTAFTPAGMDIASRVPRPDERVLLAARSAAAVIPGLAVQVSTLVRLRAATEAR